MSNISSINFKKSNSFQTFHNSTVRPNYAIGGSLEYSLKGYEALKLKNKIIDEAKQAYASTCKARNKAFQAKSYEWSAVVNIKPETTMKDLEKLATHFNDKYGFQCYQIAIHRDEGHISDNGEKVINHHAHLEFITLDKKTGKNNFRREKITPKVLRDIQSEVAEILQMQRGEDKRLSGAKRIEPRQYAKMKEQERLNTKELKAELANTKQELAQAQELAKKPNKSAIKKRLEQERKAYLNTNKALHEQGAEPIFNKEHYRELKALENNDFKSLDDLELALRELEKRIRKEQREREQRETNKKQVSFKNKDFKSALIDEYYSDLSTNHDLSEFFFDKERKSLKNNAKNYEIIDNSNSLTLINANTRDLKEQVALMIKMCESKKWDLDNLKITGNKAFCDEFKRQLKEKKEQKNSIERNEEDAEVITNAFNFVLNAKFRDIYSHWTKTIIQADTDDNRDKIIKSFTKFCNTFKKCEPKNYSQWLEKKQLSQNQLEKIIELYKNSKSKECSRDFSR